MSIAKLHREMKEHPERFDYGDLPSGELTPEQVAQAERMQPLWAKELITKANQQK